MATVIFSINEQTVYGQELKSESQLENVNIGQSYKNTTEDVYSNESIPAKIIDAGKANAVLSVEKTNKKLAESKNEILVKYKSKSKADSVKAKILKNKKASKFEVKNSNKKFQIDTIEIGESDNMQSTLEELRKNADILYAQPNYELNLFDTPSDSRFNEQWNLLNNGQAICGQEGIDGVDINVLPAWDIAAGNKTVVIGILDSGVYFEHEDLEGSIFVNENEIPGDSIDNDNNGFIDDVNGWNFFDNNADVFSGAESDSHGTHVAGIVSAVANETGVRGVASNVKVLPLKFINGNSGTTEDAINAIEYASKMGVKIINASFGSTQYNPALEEAMRESGITFATAAGNTGIDCSNVAIYPACFDIPNVISVAAIDNRGNLASFSSYGSSIDVACPGVNILSTLPNNQYGLLSGTSMAAPQIAGIAALIMRQYPELSAAEIIGRIKANVVKSNKLTGKVNSSGRVDALAALNNVAPTPEASVEMPTPIINNNGKSVENEISILNDNSATSNGKVIKPTVSDSVYGTSTDKPEYDRSGLDKVKDDIDAQSISPLSYIYETEPNNSAYTSMPVGIGSIFGTMSTNVDNDWYVVSLEAGRPYTVSLKGIPAGDNYNLYIFDPNLLDIALSFNSGNADEISTITPATTGNYYIHADCHTLGTGSDHSYQLMIYPNDTTPDAYEPNDSMGTAKTISNNTPINGTINISTDEDWYAFNAANDGKLTVTLDNIPSGCDYDVEIYDVNNNILSGSYFTGNTSEKADILVDSGNYYVRVYSYTGSSQSAYSLNVNLSTPDQHEVNDSVSAAKEVFVDSSTFGTIDNIKDVDYFEVNIEETENYIFELQNIPTGKDFDLTLYNSLGNVVASSWNSSNTDELMNISLSSGCYYIKIYSYSGFSSEQKYLLSVYRQNALTLAMPYIRVNAGETVSVPIGIQNLPSEGLCSFDFTVDYDATAMTYLNYTVDYSDPNGALVDSAQFIEANKESDGVLKILFLDNSTTFTKPLSKAGIIIKLNFQVNTGASDGAYDISYRDGSFAKVSSQGIIGVSHAIIKRGLLMIGSYGLTSLQTDVQIQNFTSTGYYPFKYGDINADASVDAIDFAVLRKFILGLINELPLKLPTYDSFAAADVNGDLGVNALDFGFFREKLLGKREYFPIQLRVPTLKLNSPTNNSTYTIGQIVNISASGTNCDHITVFVNDKCIKELPGNNFSYNYCIPEAGPLTICVKGRNVPGSSGGTLVTAPSVTINGTGNWNDQIMKLIKDSSAYQWFVDQTQDNELPWAFGFYKDAKGIYHARQSNSLQSWTYSGYNDIYDMIFDAGTSMDKAKFQFSSMGNNYIIWAWKGDYLNLGAGAELGIYKELVVNGIPTGHWLVDQSLAMPMTLTVKLNGRVEPIISYDPVRDDPEGQSTNKWWVTAFNPSYQDKQVVDLTAIFEIDFTNKKDLYEAFIKSEDYLKNTGKWYMLSSNKYKLAFIF